MASDVLAAILHAQLQRLPGILARKRDLATRLTRLLQPVADVVALPVEWPGIESTWHLYPILVQPDERDRCLAALQAEGIGAAFHYIPLHSSPFGVAHLGGRASDLPVTERVSASLDTPAAVRGDDRSGPRRRGNRRDQGGARSAVARRSTVTTSPMPPEATPASAPTAQTRVVLAAILILAVGLRVIALDKPLYIDEIVTITVGTQPLASMATVMRQIDASPALYPLLLHGWLQIARSDEWARLLSALFGVAAVCVVYLIGRRVFGVRTGIAAAFVAAIAPAHVHYAQYVRSYSLFTLLAAVQLLILTGWFVPSNKLRWRAVALTLVTAALLYTHYLAFLIVVPEGVYAAVHLLRDQWRRAIVWGLAMLVAFVLFLPGVPLLAHNMTFDRARNESRAAPPTAERLVPNLVAELSVGQRALGFSDRRVRRLTLTATAVIFPVIVAFGLAGGWRTDEDRTLLLLLFAVLPVAVYVLSGRRLVAVRFFLPFMVAYLVLLGHGLATMGRSLRTVTGLLLVIVCAVPLTHFYRLYNWSYDHRSVAKAVAQRLQPTDVLLFVHPYESFYYRWYLGDHVAMEGLVFTALEDQGTYAIKPPALSLEVAKPRVLAAAGAHERLWLIGQSKRSFASDAREEQRLVRWMNQEVQSRGRSERADGRRPDHPCLQPRPCGRRHQDASA